MAVLSLQWQIFLTDINTEDMQPQTTQYKLEKQNSFNNFNVSEVK